MAGEIIINGMRQLQDRVKRMQVQIERNKDHAARAAAVMVARAMRREAPKEQRSAAGKMAGKLRKSIRVRKVPGGYRVKPEARTAHLVIKGTAPHPITVKQAQSLYMVIDGGPVFVHSANHPGAKANPFVQRAYNLATREEAVVAAKETLFHDAPVPEE